MPTLIPTYQRLVVFHLDDRRYGLPVDAVARVIRIVEITPLPKAPEIVIGVINVRGQVTAVVDVRARFRLPQRSPALSDQLLIARTAKRVVALAVDAVEGILEYPAGEWVDAAAIVPGTEHLAGVAKLSDGMVLIHDLGSFLSLEEEQRLEQAIAHA